MILWLYRLLHRRTNFGKLRLGSLIIITLFFMKAFNITSLGTMSYPFIIVSGVIILIIQEGLLLSPYVWLKNMIYLKIVKKSSKKSIFIVEIGNHGEFRAMKYDKSNRNVGIIAEDKIYLNEGSEITLWGMNDKIVFYPNFEDFLNKEITPKDNFKTIKRKLILYNLTNNPD